MGCLKIAGRVAGAQDGDLRLHLPGCYKSKAGRARLGCDEMPNDSKEVVEKVLAFLDGRLSDEDIATVAKLMSGEDAGADLPENGISEMAADARPRHYSPVAQPSSFVREATSRIRSLDGVIAKDRDPKPKAGDFERFAARYPDAARIKHIV